MGAVAVAAAVAISTGATTGPALGRVLVAAGSEMANAAGAAAGAAADAIGGMCPANHDDKCEKQLQLDETMCQAIAGSLYGPQGKAICMRSAMQRYGECLARGPGGVRTPLHGVDTPL